MMHEIVSQMKNLKNQNWQENYFSKSVLMSEDKRVGVCTNCVPANKSDGSKSLTQY